MALCDQINDRRSTHKLTRIEVAMVSIPRSWCISHYDIPQRIIYRTQNVLKSHAESIRLISYIEATKYLQYFTKRHINVIRIHLLLGIHIVHAFYRSQTHKIYYLLVPREPKHIIFVKLAQYHLSLCVQRERRNVASV